MLWDTEAKFEALDQALVDAKRLEEGKAADLAAKAVQADVARRKQYERLRSEFEGGDSK